MVARAHGRSSVCRGKILVKLLAKLLVKLSTGGAVRAGVVEAVRVRRDQHPARLQRVAGQTRVGQGGNGQTRVKRGSDKGKKWSNEGVKRESNAGKRGWNASREPIKHWLNTGQTSGRAGQMMVVNVGQCWSKAG